MPLAQRIFELGRLADQAAGAQVLSTNTWDANRAKLSRFDWADSLEKINRAAVRLARGAAEGEYVYVAGSVGPLGQLVKPYGPLTRLHVRELFTEQLRILLEEGVDLLSFETFSSTLEATEALRAARALSGGIPIAASMTFLADGKTSFGEDAADALIEVRGIHSSYHYNGIQSWKIGHDGLVRNVYA